MPPPRDCSRIDQRIGRIGLVGTTAKIAQPRRGAVLVMLTRREPAVYDTSDRETP
jgi:hypothetical protein